MDKIQIFTRSYSRNLIEIEANPARIESIRSKSTKLLPRIRKRIEIENVTAAPSGIIEMRNEKLKPQSGDIK